MIGDGVSRTPIFRASILDQHDKSTRVSVVSGVVTNSGEPSMYQPTIVESFPEPETPSNYNHLHPSPTQYSGAKVSVCQTCPRLMPPLQRSTLLLHTVSSTPHRPSPPEERTISLPVSPTLIDDKPVISNSSRAVSPFNSSSRVSGFCNRITSSFLLCHCRHSSSPTGFRSRNELISYRQPTNSPHLRSDIPRHCSSTWMC